MTMRDQKWITNVKDILYRYHFLGFTLLRQHVADVNYVCISILRTEQNGVVTHYSKSPFPITGRIQIVRRKTGLIQIA